jgi:ParB family chromosome partitioning protein
MAKPALGRGLGALLEGVSPRARPTLPVAEPAAPTTTTATAPAAAPDTRERVERVPIGRVRPCPLQPRKDFSEEALRELADSIREQGIVQPLIVRERAERYELIAGERRWRAAQLLGLAEVPVIVREADDRAVLEMALIENLQRENLNPIEEAQGYSQLIDQFQLTQEEAAAKVGKNRASVANALRLLKLAPEVQDYLRQGLLAVGHAKVILGLPTPEEHKLAAERVIKEALNVRQTEELIAEMLKHPVGEAGAKGRRGQSLALRDPHVADLESRLKQRFGTKVHLRYHKGKGAVQIHFFDDDDLERILEIVGVTVD